MRTVLLSASLGLGLALASAGASAQIQPLQVQPLQPQQPSDPRIQPPADVLSKVPQPRREADPATKGDGITHGKGGDPIGATNDDQGRHGQAHSDPTLATKPAPPSDPKAQ